MPVHDNPGWHSLPPGTAHPSGVYFDLVTALHRCISDICDVSRNSRSQGRPVVLEHMSDPHRVSTGLAGDEPSGESPGRSPVMT